MTSGPRAASDDSRPSANTALRDAQLKFERYRREGRRLLVATAVASVLPLVAAFRPDVVPLAVGALAFPAWAGLGLITVGYAVAERIWYRRMLDRADAARGLPRR